MKIFYCKTCENVITFLDNKNNSVKCCEKDMEELIPNSEDASNEKHVPVVETKGSLVTVKVGEIPHPMEDNHYIDFVIVETNKRNIIYYLNDKPEVSFNLNNEDIVNVYAYCNLHGLWVNKKD